VVDDDIEIRTLLVTHLSERGYRLSASENGTEALAWLEENKADMLLLDLCMPGITGMEVIQKAHEMQPDLPIIVISGWADEETARKAMQMGAYDFLLKPFDLKTVESHLSAKLELIGSGAEA
jgi:DNA-binding NtrC family response regulator